jgi:co-chaperonin GroES (HSP10)
VQPLERKRSEVVVVVGDEKWNLGKVVAVGPKADSVKVGDQIRFGTAQGYLSYPEWLSETRERYLILSEADVCFVEERA